MHHRRSELPRLVPSHPADSAEKEKVKDLFSVIHREGERVVAVEEWGWGSLITEMNGSNLRGQSGSPETVPPKERPVVEKGW